MLKVIFILLLLMYSANANLTTKGLFKTRSAASISNFKEKKIYEGRDMILFIESSFISLDKLDNIKVYLLVAFPEGFNKKECFVKVIFKDNSTWSTNSNFSNKGWKEPNYMIDLFMDIEKNGDFSDHESIKYFIDKIHKIILYY